MIPLRLVRRYLLRHPVRSFLTLGSMVVAVFLLSVLRSLVVTLDAGVVSAATNRLIVQSAVSLVVEIPTTYETKIRQVEGVERTCRWLWFGGYYQAPEQFFPQFAVGHETFFESYPEIEMVEGSTDAFRSRRTACIVGRKVAETYGFAVGDTVPIIPTLFPRSDGLAWEFDVVGIYRSTSPNLDENTFFFRYDYFEEVLDSGVVPRDPVVSVYVVTLATGVDPMQVMADIDGLFENGPQRVQTSPEKEFQKQFVSMMGNVPRLLTGIGGVVLFAILLAVVNTMLMSSREQTKDLGVCKALGFSDGSVFGITLSQSILVCVLGGGLGVVLALASAVPMEGMLGTALPGYTVSPETALFGLGLSLVIGFVAGAAPAHRARRLSCVDALHRGS